MDLVALNTKFVFFSRIQFEKISISPLKSFYGLFHRLHMIPSKTSQHEKKDSIPNKLAADLKIF